MAWRPYDVIIIKININVFIITLDRNHWKDKQRNIAIDHTIIRFNIPTLPIHDHVHICLMAYGLSLWGLIENNVIYSELAF